MERETPPRRERPSLAFVGESLSALLIDPVRHCVVDEDEGVGNGGTCGNTLPAVGPVNCAAGALDADPGGDKINRSGFCEVGNSDSCGTVLGTGDG